MVRPAFRAPSSQERAKRSPQNSGASRREIARPYSDQCRCLKFESELGRNFQYVANLNPCRRTASTDGVMLRQSRMTASR